MQDIVKGGNIVNEKEVREMMCDIGRRTYQKGYGAANDGNFSVKMEEGKFLCTPTGVSKGFMTPDMMLWVDENGTMLEDIKEYKPSSEIKMHMQVYRERPDVNAVVHAHPPYATAHAVCGIALDSPIMPEFILLLGQVPVTGYGTPSTNEIPDSIAEAVREHDAVLLQNHGALSFGADLMNAYFKMESLEAWAQMNFLTKQLGGAKLLSDNEVERLLRMRSEVYGIRSPGKDQK